MQKLLAQLWSLDGEHLDVVADALGTTVAALPADLATFLDLGLLTLDDGRLTLAPPRTALSQVLERESETLEATIQRLLRMAGLVLRLGDEGPVRGKGKVEGDMYARVAEVYPGAPSIALLSRWITEGSGDLRFLRPVQWRMPTEPVVAEAFTEVLGQGREVMCIYPVGALRAARATLEGHVKMGEQVRILPEVPVQLSLVGHDRALVATGVGDEQRTLLVEHPTLVRIFVEYFDLLWNRAAPMPGPEYAPGRDDERRMLLDQLAAGRRDEQIARTLGLGLRTVRRRVADLMVELGAESRFQAGVEAVRRGLL